MEPISADAVQLPLTAIVVGGSVAGLAAGLTFGRAGWHTIVLERSPRALAERGAGLGLDLAPLQAVLGGRAPLPAHLAASGREVAIAGPDRWQVHREPWRGTHVSWSGLYRSLRSGYGGDLRSGAEVVAAGNADGGGGRGRGAWVRLADGSRLEADLVVGADGYRSTIRTAVTGQPADPEYAGYVLWRGLVEPAQLARDTAGRLFNGHLHVLAGEGRHLVVYAIPGAEDGTGRSAERLNWGWYEPMAAGRLNALLGRAALDDPRNVPIGALPPTTLHWLAGQAGQLWPSPWRDALLASAQHRQVFAAVIHQHVPGRLVRGRLVVVGDAAHVASPVTGAGARTALADALALGDALRAQDNLTAAAIDAHLAAYELARLPVARALVGDGARWGASLTAERRRAEGTGLQRGEATGASPHGAPARTGRQPARPDRDVVNGSVKGRRII
jgi:2-polyprenyl-6-methoxyphenol hydroxylase-like FAD-dependent oxidoreductase